MVLIQEVQEVRLQVEGHLQGVPGYQQVEGGPRAHQSWVGGREVHLEVRLGVRPGVHLDLDRWGGKVGHPGGTEALDI